jgi:hypothetical protein
MICTFVIRDNSCPSHNFPLIASLPYSRKAFQAFRNQLVQNARNIKSVRPIWKKLSEKGERGQENGTLGNVQGNNLRGKGAGVRGEEKGMGILG